MALYLGTQSAMIVLVDNGLYVAPSIFNTEEQRLAHCIPWVKFRQYEVYEVYF